MQKIEILITHGVARPIPLSPSIWREYETGVEDMPALEPPEDEGLAHFVRSGHVHALCGVEVDPTTLVECGDCEDCPVCRSILRRFLDGHGWEGWGKRPPGKKSCAELEDLLGQ